MSAAIDAEPGRPDAQTPARAPGRVFIVGSINIDLVLRVEHLPTAGETVSGGTLERHGGGKGANQAVAAVRAGSPVAFMGMVGADDFGEQALEELRDEGIDVSAVVPSAAAATGVACVVVDERGENQIAVASGANAELDAAAVKRWLRAASPSDDSVFLMNLEIPDPPLLAAAQHAAQMGRTIIVNPAPARDLPAALMELRPILTPNGGELEALAGGDGSPEDTARRLSGRSGAPVVVTLGARGAILVSAEKSLEVAAPSAQAVDTTGAGDAFNGSLAAALAQGYDLPSAVRRAVVAGACSVAGRGARGGMPTRDDIDRQARGGQ
ncbi:MAG: ribokinase [Solirubrobacteraceae bacterium]